MVQRRRPLLTGSIGAVLCALLAVLATGDIGDDGADVPGNDVRVLAIVSDQYGANTYLYLNSFERLGWDVTVAGLTDPIPPCSIYADALGCSDIVPDLVITKPIDVSSYDVLTIMPSTSLVPRPYRDLLGDPNVLSAIATANDLGLAISAQCSGPRVLGEAGVLTDRRVVAKERHKAFIENAGGKFVGANHPPVVDGNLITAVKGLYYNVEYVDAIASVVQRLKHPPIDGDELRALPAVLAASEIGVTEDGLIVSAFGGSSADGARGVCRSADGGTFIVGYTYSYGAGASDALVIKTDANWSVEWTRTLGGVSRDEANAVVGTPDGGCLLAGLTASVGGGGLDVLVARFDPAGNLVWARSYGDSGTEVGTSACLAHDAGFVITGYAQDPRAAASETLLLKLDHVGDPVWERTFGDGAAPQKGHDVIATRDRGYFVSGVIGHGPPDLQALLLNVDASGNIRWLESTGHDVFDSASAAIETLSGFIVTGYCDQLKRELLQVTIIGVDATGYVEWRQEYGRRNHYDYGNDVCALDDGRLLVAGVTNSHRTGQNDAWIQILDDAGAMRSSHVYGKDGSEWLASICALPGSGFAAVGHTNSEGVGSFDVLLIRSASVE